MRRIKNPEKVVGMTVRMTTRAGERPIRRGPRRVKGHPPLLVNGWCGIMEIDGLLYL